MGNLSDNVYDVSSPSFKASTEPPTSVVDITPGALLCTSLAPTATAHEVQIDNSDTPLNAITFDFLDPFHRNFNAKLFNIDVEGNSLGGLDATRPKSSKQMANQDYDDIIDICLTSQSGDELEWTQLKKKLGKKPYCIVKKFNARIIQLKSGVQVNRLFNKLVTWSRQCELWQSILNCHASLSGHDKMNDTFKKVQAQYSNITERQVQEFVRLCPRCALRNPVMKPLKLSHFFFELPRSIPD